VTPATADDGWPPTGVEAESVEDFVPVYVGEHI
jgi:hypothetical protein